MDVEDTATEDRNQHVEEEEREREDDSSDSDYIDKLIAEEEERLTKELLAEASEIETLLENSEDVVDGSQEEGERLRKAQANIRSNSTFHDTIIFLDWVFSPRIMLRITLVFGLFVVMSMVYNTVIEAMSKPTILKPKQSKPFFSNSSTKYLQDIFTGNAKPKDLLANTDLLVVMYYSPWSTRSNHMKHPFEVVAKFMHQPGKVNFVAINCWTPGSTCRTSYKLMNYPVIAAYSGQVSVMYQGAATTDNLYRWVVRLQNSVIPVNSKEELERLQAKHRTVLIGYFPFKNQIASKDYKSYAAASFLLSSGTYQDDCIAVCVVYSKQFAEYLGMRFAEDIKLLMGTESATSWAAGKSRTALNILAFVRKEAKTEELLRFIEKPYELSPSRDFSNILDKSPLLLLVTPIEPMYGPQDEVVLFSRIAEEYWRCHVNLLSANRIATAVESRKMTIDKDREACDTLNMDLAMHDDCCRSLLTTVDWNMACASGTKYRWEGEEESHKRRNHWTEEVLPSNTQCSPFRVLPASQLVQSCCDVYDKISEPYVNEAQRSLAHERLQNRNKGLLKNCIRNKLAEHFEYRLNETYEPLTYINSTIQGLGCKRNDSLHFGVINSKTEHFFLKKWGLTNVQVPLAVIIDISNDLFVVMKEEVNQDSIQRFVRDFHENLLDDYMLDENFTQPRFNRKPEFEQGLNGRIVSQKYITRLTRNDFMKVVSDENSTFDQLVFFTGGGWHGPSASVLFAIHTLTQYFDHSGDLIKFYSIDVTKNEMPYNFNFESIPSVVLFLAGRRDVSWKYPEMLPITAPNLISFIVSRCSPKLRWRTTLLNCEDTCLARNIRRLRRKSHKIERELKSSVHFSQEHPEKITKWKEYKTRQLLGMRSLLRAISSGRNGLSEIVVNRLLKSVHISALFPKLG